MSDEPTTTPSEPTSRRGAGVSSKNYLELASRVAGLEAKYDADRGSPSRKFGAVAGIVGLVISICTGLFTIFDRLVTKPVEDAASEYTQFKADLRSIITVDQEAATKASATTDLSSKTAIIQYANLQVQSLMQDAERLLRLLHGNKQINNDRFAVGSYDYGILSQTAYSGGNLQNALHYADMSITASTNFHEKSEAMRSKAVMIFQVGGKASIPSASAEIAQALTMLAPRKDFGIWGDRATLYATEAGLQAYGGDCHRAGIAAERAIEQVAPNDVPPASKQYIYGSVAGALNAQAHCALSEFPKSVRAVLHIDNSTDAAQQSVLNNAQVIQTAVGVQPGHINTNRPPLSKGMSLTCRFSAGPRVGQIQSYANVPSVAQVPIGTPCQDGLGSFGMAE